MPFRALRIFHMKTKNIQGVPKKTRISEIFVTHKTQFFSWNPIVLNIKTCLIVQNLLSCEELNILFCQNIKILIKKVVICMCWTFSLILLFFGTPCSWRKFAGICFPFTVERVRYQNPPKAPKLMGRPNTCATKINIFGDFEKNCFLKLRSLIKNVIV